MLRDRQRKTADLTWARHAIKSAKIAQYQGVYSFKRICDRVKQENRLYQLS